MTSRPGLGRRVEKDARDENFPARALVAPTMLSGYHYWSDTHWNDQNGYGTCVGHNSLNWWEDSPTTHPEVEYDPLDFYRAVCLRDPFTENDNGDLYFGTTVHASAKEMQARGMIGEYLWAHDLTTAVNWLLTRGPVLVGTTWYESMFDTKLLRNADGTVRETIVLNPAQGIAGGHCYIWNGVNTNAKIIRAKLGSWQRGSFGSSGRAALTFDDAAKLIADQGELMMTVG